MQPVPFDVLQGREQQGKGKTKARRRGPGRAAEAGREVDPREYPPSLPSLVFSAEDRSHTSPSPSSPSPSQEAPLDGPSPTQAPRGGAGIGGPTIAASSSSQIGVKAHKRPTLGPRTQAPPSWSAAAETVPSQLIGGRVGPDADGMRSQAGDTLWKDPTNAPAYFDLSTAPKSPGPSRLTPRTPRLERPLGTMPSVSEDEVPPDNAKLDESPSTSTGSGSSKDSYASSFAYALRSRRSDKRLLHKHSQPPIHLQKQPSTNQAARPTAARSASYFKPRIVEDTLTPLQHLSPSFSPVSPASPMSTASHTSMSSAGSQQSTPGFAPSPPGNPGRRKEHSSSPRVHDSAARRVRSHSPTGVPLSQQEDGKKPGLQRSDSTLSQKKPSPARHGLRIELPSPYPGYRNHGRQAKVATGGQLRMPAHRDSISEMLARTAGPFTPPEIKEYHARIPHGDHYFRTFGEDTVYQKPAPTTPFARRDEGKVEAADISVEPRVRPEKNSSDQTIIHRRGHRPKSMLLSLRKAHSVDAPSETPKSPFGTPLQRPDDPTSPALTSPRRTHTSNRSDNSTSSYFGLRRRYRDSAEQQNRTPYSVGTPQGVASSPAGHGREYSEPLSPGAAKPPRLRWAHEVIAKQMPNRKGVTEQPPKARPTEPVASPTNDMPTTPALLQTTYKSSNGREYKATSLIGPDAPNFLPSEMKRIDTPPLKEPSTARSRLRAFKSFFFDTGDMPKDDEDSVEPSAKVDTLFHRQPGAIRPRASLQSLMPKLSMPRLRHKPSQVFEEECRESDPLAVTNFQQTPFSQRYGDARRAKQTLMRAYVWDETLREDDDSAISSVDHTFELNIPEHLTNSPLCPLNEKHRSGGKAICPIHRRKKMSVNAYPAKSRTAAKKEAVKGGRREPTIVFESGKRGNSNAGAGGGGDESRRTSGV